MMIIVSACLAGVHCRYDGNAKPCEAVIRLVAEGKAIPVCPEQLGGLTTPRQSSEIVNGRVWMRDGTDVTGAFTRGAQEAINLARLAGATSAILKARSPSCGVGRVYDGTFTGRLIPGDGIFAALCRENGLSVKTEEDL
ncbi:hypothetical protein ADM99_16135 [Leptolinea tardivitalis]|uniref:Uncharacterized protein n=2 Tax=Leptolinea tardivitalis TaxID=229920 RepID=A0A0N8GKV5_9CHLR|nr:hypothetical protein ADM99_16135 [Leptolinea tardivitalis]